MTDQIDLNHADLIGLAILSEITEPVEIRERLNQLGVPLSESTVHARISELARRGLLYKCRALKGYALTDVGTSGLPA